MNVLLMKKHRLHVFVAQNEGKPIPNAPVKLSGAAQNQPAFFKSHESLSSDTPPMQHAPFDAPNSVYQKTLDSTFERQSPAFLKTQDSSSFERQPFKQPRQESFEKLPPAFLKTQDSSSIDRQPFNQQRQDSFEKQPQALAKPQEPSSFERQLSNLKKQELDISPSNPGFTASTPPPVAKKPAKIANTQFDAPVVQEFQQRNSPPPEPVAIHNMERLRALYDFDAANELEVSVKVGDLLYLVMERDDGWSQCQTENGGDGLVPTAYVGRESA